MKKIFASILAFVLFLSMSSFAFADTSYMYYYGQGCPHCAKVDKYMKGVDGYEKVNIEKKEVYFEKENAADMTADADALGIPQQQRGVPFLVIDTDGEKSFLIGDGPIIDHFTPTLGIPEPSSAKYIILTILGLLAVLIPAGIIMGGKKS